jgi:CRP/FNR family transcriptional regulator, cyclic AMP receptor protein
MNQPPETGSLRPVQLRERDQHVIEQATKIREILRAKSVLGSLPDGTLDQLVRLGRTVHYPKGAAIYHRGTPGDSLLIILSGRIKISNIASSSREVVLNFLAAGDLTGEMSALDGQPRSADATALDATEALLVYRRDILAALNQNPQAYLGLVTALTGKLRAVSAMVEHNLLQMAGKAASGLLRLAGQHGRPVAGGTLVDLKLSQKDLGNYIGLSRENTSRELNRLKDEGLIRVDGASITILDLDALRDYAEMETN